MYLQENDQDQWTGKRRIEQEKLIRTGCFDDQASDHNVSSNKSPKQYSSRQSTGKSKASRDLNEMLRFSDWVHEGADNDNAAKTYEMGISSEFWPEILRECYEEWLTLVQKVEQVRAAAADKLSNRGSSDGDRDRFHNIRSFYNYLNKEGGMIVQVGNGMRISWSFARMGPFADPKEFTALVRAFHLQDDPDLNEDLDAYRSALFIIMRDKEEIAQQLIIEVIDLENTHEALQHELATLQIREILINVTVDSRRNNIVTHDFFPPRDRAWVLEELAEDCARTREQLQVKWEKDVRVFLCAQARQHVLQFMQDEWDVDIKGMRALIEKK